WLRRLESRHRAWRYRTRTDSAEIRWLRSTLRPGDVVVDAGAYKGGYTYWMRKAVGPEGRVYAFEPQPRLAGFLREMVGAFDWKNVTVESVALCAERGRRTIHVPSRGPSQRGSLVVERDGARTYTVPTDSLDDFLARQEGPGNLALMKCDVEGNELELFRGAEQTLRAWAPRLLFECEARFHSSDRVRRVVTWLRELGYRGSFFWDGELLPVTEFHPDLHQVEGRSPYANNFVFESR
ncbi:MAG: FkbM family methyltransferase, partial [Longimicrobiales bacterium]|nr:FkbM family methyltransferase [Longimicrobiales bacterium]